MMKPNYYDELFTMKVNWAAISKYNHKHENLVLDDLLNDARRLNTNVIQDRILREVLNDMKSLKPKEKEERKERSRDDLIDVLSDIVIDVLLCQYNLGISRPELINRVTAKISAVVDYDDVSEIEVIEI